MSPRPTADKETEEEARQRQLNGRQNDRDRYAPLEINHDLLHMPLAGSAARPARRLDDPELFQRLGELGMQFENSTVRFGSRVTAFLRYGAGEELRAVSLVSV